ncbi:MAG: hypothetical protein Q4E62_06540 [Sutterellaceae bacterium]|nr:hypothetical protein [Sutterellaceae bacterium]
MQGTAPVRHITAAIDPDLGRIAVYSEVGFGLFVSWHPMFRIGTRKLRAFSEQRIVRDAVPTRKRDLGQLVIEGA